jgi:signal transduction histidine kinase
MARLTTTIVAISILLLVVGVGGAWYVHSLQQRTSDLLSQHVSNMRAAEELEIGLREVRTQLNLFLRDGDYTHLDAITKLREETDLWLEQAEELTQTPREQKLLARVKKGYQRLFEEFQRIPRQPLGPNGTQELRKLVQGLLSNEILLPAHEYLDRIEEQVAQASAESQVMARRVVLGLLLLGTCGAGAGLLAGFSLAHRVSRSLVQLSVPIRDVAGKLNEVVGPITLAAGWSLEELKVVLSNMANQVADVVARLQQSQREVLRSEQLAAVGQLAAGLAHEMRNPLMSMKLLVQSAAERGVTTSLHGRDLEILEEEITRLDRLIQTFLDFARPPRPDKRPLEVQAVLSQTVQFVSVRAEAHGVHIDCQLPAQPVAIEADLGQLRQVFLNLLLNALDAVREGGKVWVDVSHTPDSKLIIRVSDNGCGLPADLGARIFEPFVSTKETGLGLGLSICKRIIEDHGGSLTASNRPEGGAVFSIELPLVVASGQWLVASG